MKWGGGGGGGQQGLFFHHKYGARKRPACRSANTSSLVGTCVRPGELCDRHRSSRIFSPTPRLGSLYSAPRRTAGNIHTLPQTAECKLQSWGEGFQKRGERHKRVAWHLELVSNCTQISLLPAVNQPICGVLIHAFQIPREELLELICWCSK